MRISCPAARIMFQALMSGFQKGFGSRKSGTSLVNTGLPSYLSNVMPLSCEMAIDCVWFCPAEV